MDQPKRRLSAVWFADIVGYTTISSQDEPAAMALVGLLQGHARAAVATHEGRIVKFIGDAVLAEFGSTESAVRAAVALQEAYESGARELGRDSKLRVGVHLGEVTATPDGDLYGDGINTAARLQGEAQPGQVLASEDVWRQLRQRPEFRFASLGSVELKGITTRVEVYDVLFGGRAAFAARKGGDDARPSRRTRTGMHPALRAALIIVPLVVGGTLLAQRMMSRKDAAEAAQTAPTETVTAPPPAATAPVPETIVVVQSGPPAAANPSAAAPAPTVSDAPAAASQPAGDPQPNPDRPALRPRGPPIPLGPIREFLEGFVRSLGTQPPRAALARAFPDATPGHIRAMQQLRQTMADTATLRLGAVIPRGMRGDTADVRFVILGVGRGGRELQIPFEGLIARGGSGLHFTELRGRGN